MPPEINEYGPKCAFCGCRPDDPQWVDALATATEMRVHEVACLGCVADMRAAGRKVIVLYPAEASELAAPDEAED